LCSLASLAAQVLKRASDAPSTVFALAVRTAAARRCDALVLPQAMVDSRWRAAAAHCSVEARASHH
jgi:hypothetical protein